MSNKEIIEVESRIYDWFRQNASDYDVDVASPSLMTAHVGKLNNSSLLIGTTAALTLVSLLLGLAFKSLKYGLISLVPNLIPAAIGFGLWAVYDGQIGLGISVVIGMTLGIVVDDTVHFLTKYIDGYRESGGDSEKAVRNALNKTGKALLTTTFVLCAGFSILSYSTFKVNADMSFLTVVIILVALATDLLLLPALLLMVDSPSRRIY